MKDEMRELPELPGVSIHESAYVDLPCKIGRDSVVWHGVHIRAGAKIGEKCSFGHCSYVDKDVLIGDNVRVQNHCNIYKGVIIEDDVFVGPMVSFTNVRKPAAHAPVHESEYETTHVKRGASIGANAVILCGVVIGEYSLIGAGTVVNRPVPPYAMVVGNPGTLIKWLTPDGKPPEGYENYDKKAPDRRSHR